MKLNLGCGGDYRDGWTNVDAEGSPARADVRLDIFGPLPWRDRAFDEVLAHDVLEHTAWSRTEAVLTEWLRVLAPGGQIEIRVPNLRDLAERYLRGELDALGASLWIYGGQTLTHADWRLNAHYTAFDEARLRALCQAFGLTIERLETEGTNLVLVARKGSA